MSERTKLHLLLAFFCITASVALFMFRQDEDLDKSPAPILPYSHVPHRLPFVVKACSTGLPDYFTANQKFDEATFDSSLNADVWTEDVPGTPPPCYEEALEMTLGSAEMEENVFAY
ncbi:uncharacterized protein LOC110064897 [Orbicella faveolata]|uniref:uncharacterized protein LOC110064897 n=1 Tax=Orbicella faveolata TaxID=48498 RepID=UPI0009E54D0B|nr:uncharacterized protein LOC110064897 [Orbicella faveolata]